jgi:Ni2+-binding GTPase involved in maturation of urease and hydrogenase
MLTAQHAVVEFQQAGSGIINKTDLAPYVDADL